MADEYGDQDIEVDLFRATQRRAKIAAREAMSAEDRVRAREAVEAHLTTLLAGGQPRTIAFCSAVRGEVDCRPLIEQLLTSGWRACQPIVLKPETPMVFRAWTFRSIMTVDCYGIPVPASGESLVPDVVLLPLVAFDGEGFRLGYGGGYFDRTLAILTPRPLAVGVGFELARINSVRPQAHDVRLDVVVTETGIHVPLSPRA